MRHAYATTLAESGVYDRVAQHLLGHADSRMTRLIYTHVTGSMLDGAAAAVERAARRLHDDAAAPSGPQTSDEASRRPDGEGATAR